ncbi:HIRAN domain-containing protein [Thiomicrorhabdus sp. Kp2]|uniref:HIRAN domain-containing protein n=1 Tax=Thiomicrorhabdus sp. Kp2 TaxID=1123518 RepID=UPI000416935A|nr:HIRAN domain-containing protein [Thiomicrorhabdus sp. Kp2]
MKRLISFPIKGTFYYSAFLAMQENLISKNTPLIFKLEPDNRYDKNAIQIWLPTTDSSSELGLLLGYVPRSLSKKLNFLFSHNLITDIHVIHCAQQGKLIEVDCQITVNQAWQHYLLLVIQSQWITKWHKLNRLTQRLFGKNKTHR